MKAGNASLVNVVGSKGRVFLEVAIRVVGEDMMKKKNKYMKRKGKHLEVIENIIRNNNSNNSKH